MSFDKNIEPGWKKKALKYLSDRGFGYDTIKEYNLRYCIYGPFRYRIIIPFYNEGKLVNYTGRSFINKPEVNRYKHCHVDHSVMEQKDILYGKDSFEGKHLRVVEGPTDRWRLGNTSVSVSGNKITRAQRSLIMGLNVKSLSIIFDPGSYGKALSAAENFAPFIDEIKVLELKGRKDVADMSLDEIVNLESETEIQRF